jgi:tetratricopeptide (TPR) repeat protein
MPWAVTRKPSGACGRVLEIDASLANAYANRGIAYSHRGKFEKAISDFERALEIDPKIDDPPGILKLLFDNVAVANEEKGIRKYLEVLKQQVKS